MSEHIVIDCKKCGNEMSIPTQMLEPYTRNDRVFGRKLLCGWCNITKFYKLEEGRAPQYDRKRKA